MPVIARRGGVVRALDLHGAALDLGADHGDHRRLGGNRAGVVERQPDLPAGALAAGLHAGAAAPDDADVLAELAQHLVVAAPEPFAGGREDDDGDHAPQDAEHRQEAAQLVGAQVLEGLDDGFTHGWYRLGSSDGRTTLSPVLQAVEDLDLRAVADADLHRDLLPAGLRAGGRATSTNACFCAS